MSLKEHIQSLLHALSRKLFKAKSRREVWSHQVSCQTVLSPVWSLFARLLEITGPRKKLAIEPQSHGLQSFKVALFIKKKQCLNFSSSSFIIRFHSFVFLHLSKLEFWDSFDLKAIFNINSNKNHFIYRNLAASSAWQDVYKYLQ